MPVSKARREKARISTFRRAVWKHFREQGRHTLPWRKTRDPYRILVSEVMLQQTQVERVVPYYREWLRRFPTARALAAAPLSEVLPAWQGLGYNRRAKMLHEAAKALTKRGGFPKTAAELEALPGVGPYTARAVAAFAYGADEVFIETNIRTAVMHHFFSGKNDTIYSIVSDTELLEILENALPRARAGADGSGGVREWYAALMDYGAHLKRSGVRLNARAKGYKKQAAFRGSAREARGAVLKALVKGPRGRAYLEGVLGPQRQAQLREALARLAAEGLIERRGGGYRLPV